MIRLGLCCAFVQAPVRFRTTTAAAVASRPLLERRARLGQLISANVEALFNALQFCADHAIGCFRVNSQILPLRTHPKLGYDSSLLGPEVLDGFRRCGAFAACHGIRLTFHPDQFVVLSSPRAHVVKSSIAEIEYQAEVAEWIGADVITIHAGGGYGDKPRALRRLSRAIERLSQRARTRIALENDDRIYTPDDLLQVCRSLDVPLVYDVHHHRCNRDSLSVGRATDLALATWDREPLFHVSSPRDGWERSDPRPHSDHINLRDLPRAWDSLDITVEVEAKAKELAVLKLRRALDRRLARTRRSA